MRPVRALQKEVLVNGIGLHTGQSATMRITPAEQGSGIRFVRTDLPGQPVIPAEITHVSTTVRGTTLQSQGHSVATVEHFLAACHALGLQDVTVEIDGPEVPILDGSAAIYIEKCTEAGLTNVESNREPLVIASPFTLKDEASGAEYAVFPADKLELNVILQFPQENIGPMVALMDDLDTFSDEISKARTFVFLSEVEALFDAGLIKGGEIENAVVLIDTPADAAKLNTLLQKMGKAPVQIQEGQLTSTPMRFSNEPARHKLLDLLGDLTLLGRDIHARIIATRPGHTGNAALTKMLKSIYLEQKKNAGKPVYDPNAEPLMNTEEIKKFLPHRYPFLMVDKVIEINDTSIVAVKNITFNETFFLGHFPGNPVFPGVLQMEALAQTGGILALKTVSDGTGIWDTYFLKMDNVKFKSKVLPGDTLILKMEMMGPIRRGIIQMWGTAYVGNKLVSEGELTAQIVKRQDD